MEIKKPKEFVSLRIDRKKYQETKDQIKTLERFKNEYKELLLKRMRLNPYSMGDEARLGHVNSGSVELELKAERRIGKPAYKSIVEGWEASMNGINFASETRTLTGVLKEDEKNYISCESALSDFVRIAYGTLEPTIQLKVLNAIGADEEDLIYVPNLEDRVVLDKDSAIAYINAPAYIKALKELSKQFREEAGEKAEAYGLNVVPVTQDIGIKSENFDRVNPDYKYVVTTLITMPTEKLKKDAGPRELEILGDERYDFGKRFELFDKVYDLIKHDPYGKLMLYVGVDSVIERITNLKEESEKTATVYKAQTAEL